MDHPMHTQQQQQQQFNSITGSPDHINDQQGMTNQINPNHQNNRIVGNMSFGATNQSYHSQNTPERSHSGLALPKQQVLSQVDYTYSSPFRQNNPIPQNNPNSNLNTSSPDRRNNRQQQQQLQQPYQQSQQQPPPAGYQYLSYVSHSQQVPQQQLESINRQQQYPVQQQQSQHTQQNYYNRPSEEVQQEDGQARGEKESKVLLVTLQNPRDEVIQHKIIFTAFIAYGAVEQILIFSKKQQWKFFVDMDSIESASRAMAFLDSTTLKVNGFDLRMRVQYSNQPVLHLKNGNPGGINYKELNGKFENTHLSYSLTSNCMSAQVQHLPRDLIRNNSYTTSHSASLPYSHNRSKIQEVNSSSSGNVSIQADSQQQQQQQPQQQQQNQRFQSANLLQDGFLNEQQQKLHRSKLLAASGIASASVDDDQEKYFDDLLHLINQQPGEDDSDSIQNSKDDSSLKQSSDKYMQSNSEIMSQFNAMSVMSASQAFSQPPGGFNSLDLQSSFKPIHSQTESLQLPFRTHSSTNNAIPTIDTNAISSAFCAPPKIPDDPNLNQPRGISMLDRLLGEPVEGDESSEENEIAVSDDDGDASAADNDDDQDNIDVTKDPEFLESDQQLYQDRQQIRKYVEINPFVERQNDAQEQVESQQPQLMQQYLNDKWMMGSQSYESVPQQLPVQSLSRFATNPLQQQQNSSSKVVSTISRPNQSSKSGNVKFEGVLPLKSEITNKPPGVSLNSPYGSGNVAVVSENMGLFNGTTYVKQGFLEDSRPSKVIYVNHLVSSEIQMVHLYNVFSNFGDILKILLKKNKNTAFIEYTTQEFATRAKDFMDKKYFFETELRVFYSHFDTILHSEIEEEESNAAATVVTGSAMTPSAEITAASMMSPSGLANKSATKNPDKQYFIGTPATFRFAKEAKMTLNSPSLVIHISNLKQEVCDHEKMMELFSQFGKIDVIHTEKVPPRYMCHIKYSSIKESIMAVAKMHNVEIKGRKMFISFTRKKLDLNQPTASSNSQHNNNNNNNNYNNNNYSNYNNNSNSYNMNDNFNQNGFRQTVKTPSFNLQNPNQR